MRGITAILSALIVAVALNLGCGSREVPIETGGEDMTPEQREQLQEQQERMQLMMEHQQRQIQEQMEQMQQQQGGGQR